MKNNIPLKLIVHHCGGTDLDPLADSSNQKFEDVNAWHRQNPNVWLGYYSSLGYAIGYHYFIDKTGKVTQGRADNDEGAHTIGQNTSSIGICLAGNFDATLPSEAQINALRTLLVAKSTQYHISTDNIFPHRHFAVKTCYGSKLPDDWAKNLVLSIPSNDKVVQARALLKQALDLLQ